MKKGKSKTIREVKKEKHKDRKEQMKYLCEAAYKKNE